MKKLLLLPLLFVAILISLINSSDQEINRKYSYINVTNCNVCFVASPKVRQIVVTIGKAKMTQHAMREHEPGARATSGLQNIERLGL